MSIFADRREPRANEQFRRFAIVPVVLRSDIVDDLLDHELDVEAVTGVVRDPGGLEAHQGADDVARVHEGRRCFGLVGSHLRPEAPSFKFWVAWQPTGLPVRIRSARVGREEQGRTGGGKRPRNGQHAGTQPASRGDEAPQKTGRRGTSGKGLGQKRALEDLKQQTRIESGQYLLERPRDPAIIRARAAEARTLLEGWTTPVVRDGLLTIDLAVENLAVGQESKDRAHNYEAGNVLAIRYADELIPGDEKLRSDLTDMLQLLGRVYEGSSGQGTVEVPSTGTGGQRRIPDGRLRRAIEDRAMAVVQAHYFNSPEWTDCQDVSRYQSYDLACRRADDDGEVHVEVKGTTTQGQQVILTRNEVVHAREFPHTVLAVVSEIEVTTTQDEVVATGGILSLFDPWALDEVALTPTEFVYSIPVRSQPGH